MFAMLVVVLSSWGQTSEQTAAIKEISAAAAAIKTMQCDFVQTKTLKMLGDKMVSKGRMCCKQPDKLLWEYVTPYTYTFVLNANKVLLKKGKRNDVIDVNQNKMFREIARIMMSTVVGNCLTDKKEFATTIVSKDNRHIATLTPQKKEMRQMFSKIVLHYDRKAAMVVEVELHEKNGDTTIIELQNVKKNSEVNASVFAVN